MQTDGAGPGPSTLQNHLVAGTDMQERKRILVLGGRKSGKTSCIRTVFSNLNPKDTIWLEMTTKVNKLEFDSVVPLELWDTPGNYDAEQYLELPWTEFSSIVYVVDIQQDSYADPISRLVPLFVTAYAHNPALNFEVFAHKADGLSLEYQEEYFRELSQRIQDEIFDFNLQTFFSAGGGGSFSGSANDAAGSPHSPSSSVTSPIHIALDQEAAFIDGLIAQLRFFTTSVNDASIFEAWSKVIQKLMEGIYGAMEGLMNTFVTTSSIDKSFLFDVNAKIYIAMDISSVESTAFRLCSDYLGRMLIFKSLYDGLPVARRKAFEDGGSSGANPDGAEDDDYDEKEWPVQVTRLGTNTSIAFWQFSPYSMGLPHDKLGAMKGKRRKSMMLSG